MVKIFKKADTPIRRIGMVFIIIAFSLCIYTIFDWNIFHKGFFYRYQNTWSEQIPPPASISGRVWRKEGGQWLHYDMQCLNEEKKYNSQSERNFGIEIPMYEKFVKVCVKNSAPAYSIRYKYEWRSSFDEYFEESFDNEGDYYTIYVVIFSIMSVGIFMYIGKVDKFIKWVKFGQIGKD